MFLQNNRYFSQRVQTYEQKMKHFKTQFEQLNDYFKVHDKDNMLDLQSLLIYFCLFSFLALILTFAFFEFIRNNWNCQSNAQEFAQWSS